eukprot:7179059-Pyramimonas_sp.AAC.2
MKHTSGLLTKGLEHRGCEPGMSTLLVICRAYGSFSRRGGGCGYIGRFLQSIQRQRIAKSPIITRGRNYYQDTPKTHASGTST